MIINGRSYYQFILRRRSASVTVHPVGPQEQNFGLASFLAFFSTKILRGGPRVLLQLASGLAVLLLVLKVVAPHRLTDVKSSAWNWQSGTTVVKPGVVDGEEEENVPGGLRIVVFGDSDVATPQRLEGKGEDDAEGRSWTEVLCEELNCTSYLSFVPTPSDPSAVMTSTRLYASSVERSLNLTFEDYGPGLDYNFMLDQFPIEWRVSDLSKQLDEFLSTENPKHAPAETIWVFSFGMWDIWSLASEPLGVSKEIVDRVVDHMFVEVERLYVAALDETSVAWSHDPVEVAVANATEATTGTASSAVSEAMPTATPDPETNGPPFREGGFIVKGEETSSPPEPAPSAPDNTKHFRILIPRLFDPSLTPGWHDTRPNTPEVHSKAEQLRNAAALTEKWNNKMYAAMTDWVRTPTGAPPPQQKQERRRRSTPAAGAAGGRSLPRPGKKKAAQIMNEKVAAAVPVGGQNHIVPTPPPPPPATTATTSATAVGTAGLESTATDEVVARPQRDAIWYEMNRYLEEVIVERQMRDSGLRDARKSGSGKLTEEEYAEGAFSEVRTPCVGEPPEPTGEVEAYTGVKEEEEEKEEAEEEATTDASSTAVDGGILSSSPPSPVVDVGEGAYERRESGDRELPRPTIRGRSPITTVVTTAESVGRGAARKKGGDAKDVRVCDDPDEHLFFTQFAVAARAVAFIASEAADMVARNRTMRAEWAGIMLPPLRSPHGA